jgi:putative DNA primase/helicase
MVNSQVIHMNNDYEPPSSVEAAVDDGDSTLGGGGAAPRKREKRKKRKPVGDADALTKLYKNFAYQYGTEVAWDVLEKMPIRISHLRHTFGDDAVKLWMASPKRRMVKAEQIVFDPSGASGEEAVNLYRGRGVEPIRGDVAPFYELLDYVCSGDPGIKDYVLNFYALPLQKPGFKLPASLVFHGAEGTGKNLLNELIMSIHGRSGKVVGQRELESQWNDWLSGCTFVIGDEVVSRQEMRHHKGVLKALITGTDVNIATKFMNTRSERNCMNIVFLSNELEPLKLDPTDRRYCVIWTQRRGDPAMYARFVAWRNAGGAAHLLHELLERDLSGWLWHEPPPTNQAKTDLIDMGRLSPERFWLDWRGKMIDGLPHQVCSADQAYRAYLRWCRNEGERYPMSKPVFSRLVKRQADDLLDVRMARIGATDTTTRVWCVTPPPADKEFKSWSGGCVEAFEGVLSSWLGRGGSNE